MADIIYAVLLIPQFISCTEHDRRYPNNTERCNGCVGDWGSQVCEVWSLVSTAGLPCIFKRLWVFVDCNYFQSACYFLCLVYVGGFWGSSLFPWFGFSDICIQENVSCELTLKCISNVNDVICYRRLQDIRNEILDLHCFLSVNVVDPQG